MANALDPTTIAALLKNDTTERRGKYTPEPSHYNFSDGPLRHYEKEMRCASRGCASPTHFKLKGIPKCMIHCLREMNEMLANGDVGTMQQTATQ